MLSQAQSLRICCSFQPCPNEADGELTVADNGEEVQLPICQEHANKFIDYSDFNEQP